MKARDLSAAVVFAGLYAAGVIALPGLSFEIIQVRISDALLPLSMVFGMSAVVGVTVGTFVANMFSPFGPVDLLGGTLTNLVATYMAWKMARNFVSRGSWLFISFFQVLLVTFIVGSYLYVLAGSPTAEVFGFQVHGIVFSWLGVFAGSVVAIVLVGYPVAKAVARYLVAESRYVR
ncbi:MAG: QueT transporter family protein [Candidatus Caldarchaeum sp.]|nr:QueT transporter family protein [Candidatus Caldarchaeum sp.]MDW8359373.1 QueT transporter family protein [Candidatus Caldarchaeum sp.]